MDAADRTFAISELLSHILRFSNQSTRAAAALTCRAWRETAVDELWREVKNPVRLFQLLAPLTGTPGFFWVSNISSLTPYLMHYNHVS